MSEKQHLLPLLNDLLKNDDTVFQKTILKIKTQRACFRFLWRYLSEHKQQEALELLYWGYKVEVAYDE